MFFRSSRFTLGKMSSHSSEAAFILANAYAGRSSACFAGLMVSIFEFLQFFQMIITYLWRIFRKPFPYTRPRNTQYFSRSVRCFAFCDFPHKLDCLTLFHWLSPLGLKLCICSVSLLYDVRYVVKNFLFANPVKTFRVQGNENSPRQN